MNIFTTSIRSYLNDNPNITIAIDSKSGRFKILGPLEKKFISIFSHEARTKLFGINNEKLPELIAKHSASSSVEQILLDDNISCLIELGILPRLTSHEKIHDVVIEAFNRLN